MSSRAFRDFRYNIVDVERLIESHSKLHSGGRGKKALGHITRSGVVMLCAAWEFYTESLVVEALTFLVGKCSSPNQLPLEVQKELAKYVRRSKHELKPLALSNDGWRGVLVSHALETCATFHTPKAGPLNELFKKLLGIGQLSSSWSCEESALDGFVGVRGGIAHRGRKAVYITIGHLKGYLELILRSAIETDNAVSSHLVSAAPGGRKPWKITT